MHTILSEVENSVLKEDFDIKFKTLMDKMTKIEESSNKMDELT